MAWYDDIVDALTTSADTEASEPVVSRGDQGEEIEDIQQRLINLGYDLGKSGADGVFGLNTEKAFQKFQGDFNLPQTGLATGPTLDAIFSGGIPLETVEGETPLPTPPNVNSSNLVPTDNATYFANGGLLPPESEDEPIVVEDEPTVLEEPAVALEEPVVEPSVVNPPEAGTGLNSPSLRDRTKAVQTIIGTTADGDFGRGSQGKLRAWQYVHDLPTSGEMDVVTMEALKDPDTYDPKGITRSNFMQTPTFDLLKGVEGFREKAYLGAIGKNFKSGLTVGAGIDFGQHTKEALLAIGLPKSLVDKADNAGWVNLNPDTIVDPRTGSPVSQGGGTKTERRARGEVLLKEKLSSQKAAGTFPSFTYEELAASTPVMYQPYLDEARKDFDAEEGEGSFDSLSEGTQAVITTEKYHRGATYNVSYLFAGARVDNPVLAAEGIGTSSRRSNMISWLRKVGLDK